MVKTNIISLSITISLLTSLLSCNSRNKENLPTDVICLNIDVSTVKDYDISEQAEIVKLVALETTEESLIGDISKIHITENKILIFDDMLNKILLFDRDGHFLRQIGKKGEGPEEYVTFNDIFFDEKTDLVYANERMNGHIYVYNLDGELLERKYSKHMFNSFCVTDEGFWAYTCFKSKDRNPEGYALMLLDRNDPSIVVKSFFPQKEFFASTHKTRFFKDSNGNILFIYPFSNIAYQLENSSIKPYYMFNFTERNLPYEEIRNSTDVNYLDNILKESRYFGGHGNFVFTEKEIYFSFGEFARSYTNLAARYNKSTGNSEVYKGTRPFTGKNLWNKRFDALFLRDPLSSYKDNLIFQVKVDGLCANDLTFLQQHIKQLNIESNPILFFVKLQ